MIPNIDPEKASIETTTACNHLCSYCPVSKFPQKQHIMSLDFFDHVMGELESLGRHMRRISFTHYNEPLLDPLLIERVRVATRYSFYNVIVLFSNLSMMPESLPEDLQFAKERLVFSVNLPTIDRERYKDLQGVDHLPQVESNIAFLVSAGYVVKVNIQSNILTTQDDKEGVIKKYGELMPVEIVNSDSRAGLVLEPTPKREEEAQTGCSIKRPINHVHIGIDGEVFLCCQDFWKKYRFGSLREETLKDILSSEFAREYLEYIYVGKEAPNNFICETCEFAVRGNKER